MDFLREKRPPCYSIPPLNHIKKRKNNDNSGDLQFTPASCSALADNSACKICLDSSEYIKILSSTIQEVFQENQALQRRVIELESILNEMNLSYQQKQNTISTLNQTIKSSSL